MKIYTTTGDGGETSLFGGRRVPKDALRIEAYGTVDELNSALGVARAWKPAKDIDGILGSLQNDLFVLGADLATPAEKRNVLIERIQQEHITQIERIIDTVEALLKPLSSFILPGGTHVAAQLHLARTICRRAERFVVKLSREEPLDPHAIVFLNRVSDLLFILARYANQVDGVEETPWKAREL
ncbi:MAG: cob(I)yrinic acid a,c-diamide adenosyltransferase [Ignavibacteriales bacterium]|nr:cob(I)yrinic acid a,c-diamide adenosyltransferase [Ignavibacteriales bacterium]